MSSFHILIKIPLSFTQFSSEKSFNLNHKNSLVAFSRTDKRWGVRSNVGRVFSEAKESSNSLQIGSPIIIVEAPTMLKTAASVPCLRANSGLVKAGDVGRIMSRKPKDVWAVRLSIGTYLIDGKYFKPLQLDEDN